MSELTFQFQVTGPKADETADALSAFLADTFGRMPRVQKLESPKTEPGGNKKISAETWAVLAVILALPGAVYNLEKLAERHELKQKLEKLIAWGRERRAGDPETYVDLLIPGRLARRLEGMDEVEILNDIGSLIMNKGA